MWSKPVALGLLAVAIITGAVAGAYVARHTGVEGAAAVAPARQPTSKPAVAPAAPTAHAAPVAQPPAEAEHRDTPAATEPRRGPEKPKARPDRSSAARTVPLAETKVDPASALPAPLSMPAPVQPVPEESPQV